VDVDLAKSEGKKLVSNSKFRLMQSSATLFGACCAQDHGDLVSFRRIQLRELISLVDVSIFRFPSPTEITPTEVRHVCCLM